MQIFCIQNIRERSAFFVNQLKVSLLVECHLIRVSVTVIGERAVPTLYGSYRIVNDLSFDSSNII